MSSLVLCFSGALQSWGSRSRFSERDTEMEPTRSGVIGLLCSALGRPRTASIDDFNGLKMGVRVDREGILIRDFHTALNVRRARGGLKKTELSNRFYLSDAVFLVVLEGEMGFLAELDKALQQPRHPLFLGRKACPPGVPVRVPGGLTEESIERGLASWPLLGLPKADSGSELRCVVEAEEGDEVRNDVPISFELGNRSFASRRIKTVWVQVPDAGGDA